MAQDKPSVATRVPRWLRFVLVLWTVALLLLGLQALEIKLYEWLGS